ncbi:MAG: glutathione S-transferase family protein [bacterium]
MMKLYYSPGTIALASLITLEELGVAYEPVRVDFTVAAQRGADYLAINAKGRVPSLVTDQGVLTETPAILSYLAQTHPAAGLLSGDAFAVARVQEMMSYLCSTAHVSHAHRMRGSRWSDDPVVIEGLKLKVTRNVTEHFTYLEGRFVGPWALGDYSLADPYLYVLASWCPSDGVDLARFPKIAAHFAAMNARPAVQRALAVQS